MRSRSARSPPVMPITAVAAGLAGLSMVGVPPLFGFIGKELVYETTLYAPLALSWATTLLTVVALVVIVDDHRRWFAGCPPLLG
ncbi:MAG: hypothetical protein R3E79_39335 [Caldilineaceae bacterium]